MIVAPFGEVFIVKAMFPPAKMLGTVKVLDTCCPGVVAGVVARLKSIVEGFNPPALGTSM